MNNNQELRFYLQKQVQLYKVLSTMNIFFLNQILPHLKNIFARNQNHFFQKSQFQAESRILTKENFHLTMQISLFQSALENLFQKHNTLFAKPKQTKEVPHLKQFFHSKQTLLFFVQVFQKSFRRQKKDSNSKKYFAAKALHIFLQALNARFHLCSSQKEFPRNCKKYYFMYSVELAMLIAAL